VVSLSFSDTEEALELLFFRSDRDPVSRVSEPSSCSSNDLIDDWPEANDMTVSVYVALTVDASSTCISTANAPCGDREFHAGGSSTRQSSSHASSRRSHR
jgi:hypothetical protein